MRATGKDKLLACVMGTPKKMVANENTLKVCTINFLCIHKKLRQKKLAPILIKEVTRLVNLSGVWQAYYTSGELIPLPFLQA